MKDNSGFADNSTIPDDDTLKTATDNLNAEFAKEGIIDQSDAPYTGESPTEEVAESEDKKATQPDENDFVPPSKKNGEQRRLRKALEQRDQIIAYQNQELERARQELGNSQHETLETAKHTLEVKRYTIKEKIKEAYKEAQLTGDFGDLTELQSMLSEVDSEYNQLKKQKPVEEQPYYPAYNEPENSDHPFKDWLADNPWYNNDPDLQAEADEIYREWKKRLVLNNREDLLNTYEFYDEIGNTIKSRYMQPQQAQTPKRRNAQVPQYGGASHLNGAYGKDINRPENVPLTIFDKELAHTMPTSKPMTNIEKEALFRKYKN